MLQRIRGTTDVHAELEDMVHSATDKQSGDLKASATAMGLLEDPRIRRALMLGCGLQLLQQLSGINTVMYYSASIFRFVSLRADVFSLRTPFSVVGPSFAWCCSCWSR